MIAVARSPSIAASRLLESEVENCYHLMYCRQNGSAFGDTADRELRPGNDPKPDVQAGVSASQHQTSIHLTFLPLLPF